MKPVKNTWPYPYQVGQRYKMRRNQTLFFPHSEIEIMSIDRDGENIGYKYIAGSHSYQTTKVYFRDPAAFLECTIIKQ